jgi:hypothetical protein
MCNKIAFHPNAATRRGRQMEKAEVKACIITFSTTHHVLHAEKLLRSTGIDVELVPVPRYISSDCGICIKLHCMHLDKALALLRAEGVNYEGVHKMEASPTTLLQRLLSRRKADSTNS